MWSLVVHAPNSNIVRLPIPGNGELSIGRATPELKTALFEQNKISRSAFTLRMVQGSTPAVTSSSLNKLKIVRRGETSFIAKGETAGNFKNGDELWVQDVKCVFEGPEGAVLTQPEDVDMAGPVDDFLKNAGLEELIPTFRAELLTELDMLKFLKQDDLDALGLRLGHKLKFQKAMSNLFPENQNLQQSPSAPSLTVVSSGSGTALSSPDANVVVAEDDVIIVQNEEEEEFPPPPAAPPVLCSRCQAPSCIACEDCTVTPVLEDGVLDLLEDEQPTHFCWSCFSLVHDSGTASAHVWDVRDGDVLLSQRHDFEAALERHVQEVVSVCRESLTTLSTGVLPRIASDRVNALVGEAKAILNSMKSPALTVVVVGDTGAGKSSTLNSLLGESSLLPTNGMRACTSSIIACSFNKEPGARYRASVEMFSNEDWNAEMDLLLGDLRQQKDPTKLNRHRGEEDSDSPVAIAWAKIQLIYGVSTVDTVEEFEALRRRGSRVTRMLGKTIPIEAEDSESFRRKLEKFADSGDSSSELSFWPVVRQIKVSGPWEVLRSGCVLIDAPGVRDDNPARDQIVKTLIKDAGLLLICSRIQRAVNDKIARTLLGETFRRQLVMDESSLAFCCTQTDVLNRQELARNLGLSDDTSSNEVALRRNRYSQKRLQDDFLLGMRDVLRGARYEEEEEEEPQDLSPAQEEMLRRRPKLPVFCVSSREFMAFAGLIREEPAVFRNVNETGIPKLSSFLYALSIEKHKAQMKQLCVRTLDLFHVVCNTLKEAGASNSHGAALRNLFDAAEKNYWVSAPKFSLGNATESFLNAIRSGKGKALFFASSDKLAAQYTAPWLKSDRWVPNCKPQDRKGGLHWGTLKALCRRNGRHKGAAGLLDFNEEMSEPFLSFLVPQWNSVFSEVLPRIIPEFVNGTTQAIEAALQQFFFGPASALESKDRLARVISSVQTSLRRFGENLIGQTLQRVQALQRDVSRLPIPLIQENLKPTYLEAASKHGIGSVGVRSEVMRVGVREEKGPIYDIVTETLIVELRKLLEGVCEEMDSVPQRLLGDARAICSSLWQELDSDAAARAQEEARALEPLVLNLQAEVQRIYARLHNGVLQVEQLETGYFAPPAPSAVPQLISEPSAPSMAQPEEKREREEEDQQQDEGLKRVKREK